MAPSSRSRKTVGSSIIKDLTKGAKKWHVEIMGLKSTMYAVALTPEMAERIIEHCNLSNRKVRQNKVLEWAEYMNDGVWELRGEIIMTESGELIDGQHRILAVVESGQTVPFILSIIPTKSAKEVNRYLDSGVPRNLVDYLHFNGVAYAARVAPVLVYERNARICGSPLQSTKGRKDEFLELYEEIGEEAFKQVFEIMPAGLHKRLNVNRGFLDWFGLHVQRIDRGGAELFLATLYDPSEMKKTDPSYVLQEELRKLQSKSQKVSIVQQAHMTVKAWKLFGESQPATIGKIRHRVNEDWPGIFGEAG
jgi:hypothetical protein